MRQLVRPQLRTFPLVVQDAQTTAVVNETLLRLLAVLEKPQVRPPTVLEFERFLAGIIRHVLLDMHKAIQRRRQKFVELGDNRAPAPDDDPIDTDLMVAFHEYVESLPADEQALFDVFYYQGKTKEEAARILGLPPTTAHTHWVKARFHLQQRFGRDLTE